jgi:hypothetical protein
MDANHASGISEKWHQYALFATTDEFKNFMESHPQGFRSGKDSRSTNGCVLFSSPICTDPAVITEHERGSVNAAVTLRKPKWTEEARRIMPLCSQSVASTTGMGDIRRLAWGPQMAVAEHSPVRVAQDPKITFTSMWEGKFFSKEGESQGLLASTSA